MRSHRYWIASFALVSFSIGCSHKTVRIDEPAAPPKEGEVAMQFGWIKDKGKKYDLRLEIINNTDKSVLLYLSDLHCFKGTTEGTLKHTFFNTGHRTFKYHPGERGEYNMVCNLSDAVEGDYRVQLAKVYENPNGDGSTAGKQVAGNIEISQKSQ